jgi:hypothetical protein
MSRGRLSAASTGREPFNARHGSSVPATGSQYTELIPSAKNSRWLLAAEKTSPLTDSGGLSPVRFVIVVGAVSPGRERNTLP